MPCCLTRAPLFRTSSWVASAGMRVGVGKHEGVGASSEATAPASAAAGVSSSPGMTRIYMGGLGGGVTEADVEKTFAPLGRVARVEFVRTKGRAFAFMHFEPKSDKSLAKLFATYNGCIWKGGRLRLEKAKEHYLNRLRREWAEDAEPTKKPIVVDMSKGLISSDKSKSRAEEKMQLRIFFPKLRKVKALPLKGTGKHKYSFQRIVAPLPVHFCDCEVHYQSPEDPSQNQLNHIKDRTVVVNEEELSIMNSVMKKLFEKEANTIVADGKAFSATERDILDNSNNETQFGDGEAAQQSDADADNLMTNIGLGDNEDVLKLMQLKGWDAASADQGLKSGKCHSFHHQLVPEKQNIWKRQKTGPGTVSEAPCSKKAHLPSEKCKKSELLYVIAGKMRHQETEHQEWNDLPAIESQGSNYPTVDPDIIKSKTTQRLAFGQSANGTSWIQKSSWKELVRDSESSIFTISHVLPGANSPSAGLSKFKGVDNIRAGAERATKSQSSGSYLKPLEVWDNIPVKKIAAPRDEEKSSKEDGTYVVGKGGLLDKAPRSSSNQEEPKSDAAKVGVGQVCSFMRSADSQKEWTKAKAALTGHLKKKKKKET